MKFVFSFICVFFKHEALLQLLWLFYKSEFSADFDTYFWYSQLQKVNSQK